MKKSLSVVMGMHNEVENVEPVTSEVARALEAENIPYEIICVSNGSTDGTEEELTKAAQKNPNIHPILLKEKGYGRAVITGFSAAQKEWVTLVSGDGQVDPNDILNAYEAMEKTGADVIKPRRVRREDNFVRTCLVQVFNLLVKIVFWLPGWDVDGPPKVIRRDFLQKLKLESTDFWIDAEMMIKTKYLGGTVSEIPVGWRERKRGTPFIANALMRTSWQYFKNLVRWRLYYRTLVVKKLNKPYSL